MGTTLPPTFWDLAVRAAREQPETPVVSDDHGRSLTRRQLLRGGRGNRGRALGSGCPGGHGRVLAVADVARGGGAPPRLGPDRRGTEPVDPDPAASGRSRSSPARSAPSSWSFRRSGVASTTGQWRGTSLRPVALPCWRSTCTISALRGQRRISGCPREIRPRSRRPRHSTGPVGSTTRRAPPPIPRAPATPTPASWPRPTPCSS